jgi:signal transduction histidine kinase
VRALAALFGLSRVSFAKLALALALFVLALGLAIAALAQLIDALELSLIMLVAEPALASLITGLILLGLALLFFLLGRLYLRREARVARVAATGARADLLAQAMTMLGRYSGQTALLAAAVGLLVGILPGLFGDRPAPAKRKSREERVQEPEAGS